MPPPPTTDGSCRAPPAVSMVGGRRMVQRKKPQSKPKQEPPVKPKSESPVEPDPPTAAEESQTTVCIGVPTPDGALNLAALPPAAVDPLGESALQFINSIPEGALQLLSSIYNLTGDIPPPTTDLVFATKALAFLDDTISRAVLAIKDDKAALKSVYRSLSNHEERYVQYQRMQQYLMSCLVARLREMDPDEVELVDIFYKVDRAKALRAASHSECTEEPSVPSVLKAPAWKHCLRVAAKKLDWESAALRISPTKEMAQSYLELTVDRADKLQTEVIKLREHLACMPRQSENNESSDTARPANGAGDGRNDSTAKGQDEANRGSSPSPTAQKAKCQKGCHCPKRDPVVEHFAACCRRGDDKAPFLTTLEDLIWRIYDPEVPFERLAQGIRDGFENGLRTYKNGSSLNRFVNPDEGPSRLSPALQQVRDRLRMRLPGQAILKGPLPCQIPSNANKVAVIDDYLLRRGIRGPLPRNIFNMELYKDGLPEEARQHFCYGLFSGIALAYRFTLGMISRKLDSHSPHPIPEDRYHQVCDVPWPEYLAPQWAIVATEKTRKMPPAGRIAMASIIMGILDERMVSLACRPGQRLQHTFPATLQGLFDIFLSGYRFLRMVGEVPPLPAAAPMMSTEICPGLKVRHKFHEPHVWAEPASLGTHPRKCEWEGL